MADPLGIPSVTLLCYGAPTVYKNIQHFVNVSDRTGSFCITFKQYILECSWIKMINTGQFRGKFYEVLIDH